MQWLKKKKKGKENVRERRRLHYFLKIPETQKRRKPEIHETEHVKQTKNNKALGSIWREKIAKEKQKTAEGKEKSS